MGLDFNLSSYSPEKSDEKDDVLKELEKRLKQIPQNFESLYYLDLQNNGLSMNDLILVLNMITKKECEMKRQLFVTVDVQHNEIYYGPNLEDFEKAINKYYLYNGVSRYLALKCNEIAFEIIDWTIRLVKRREKNILKHLKNGNISIIHGYRPLDEID